LQRWPAASVIPAGGKEIPMLKGSCLCGVARYEVDGEIHSISHCHCSMCRKGHGAAFATYGNVAVDTFRWTEGEDAVSSYSSSPGAVRTFCRHCGSNLQWKFLSKPERFGLALGTLDDDPVGRPDCNIYVDSKAPWFEITDQLRQYSGDND
jgi:hypothetical protein